MSRFQVGKASSLLWCVRLLLAIGAADSFAHPSTAQTRGPLSLPTDLVAHDERVYASHQATLEAPLFCSQSAGQTAAESPREQDPAQTVPPATSQTEPTGLDRRDRIFYPGDTERLKPLGRKLLLNILLDQKDIFTSLFRMNRDNAKWWLLSGAVTAGLIVADRRITNSFENSRGQVQWGGRISQIGASYTLVPLVAGYYGFGVLTDHAKAREIGVLGTESLLDSLIVAGVLKEVFRRNRPDENKPGDFWGGGTSFPSGHAIQVWSIASLVSLEYTHQPIVGVVAYSLAAVVSASRIAAQKHFASDIFVGGTMGWFIGRYVYDIHMSHLAHKHSSLLPLVVPQVQVATRSYGAMLLFDVH